MNRFSLGSSLSQIRPFGHDLTHKLLWRDIQSLGQDQHKVQAGLRQPSLQFRDRRDVAAAFISQRGLRESFFQARFFQYTPKCFFSFQGSILAEMLLFVYRNIFLV